MSVSRRYQYVVLFGNYIRVDNHVISQNQGALRCQNHAAVPRCPGPAASREGKPSQPGGACPATSVMPPSAGSTGRSATVPSLPATTCYPWSSQRRSPRCRPGLQQSHDCMTQHVRCDRRGLGTGAVRRGGGVVGGPVLDGVAAEPPAGARTTAGRVSDMTVLGSGSLGLPWCHFNLL